MRLPVITLCAAVFGAGLALAAPSPQGRLSPKDIETTFFNGTPFIASTTSSVKYKMVFTADNKMTREPVGKKGGKGEGTWRLSADGFCSTWMGSKENCFRVQSNGDKKWAIVAGTSAVAATGPGRDGVRKIDLSTIEGALQKKALLYDKMGEEHYNIISALHKSLRGSDPDAALYWLARMLEAGEDPLYVARRMIRFASEDIGNADPQALVVAIAAKDAVHFIGMPEGDLALAQAAIYLATAPKSNAVYTAYGKAREDVNTEETPEVPFSIRNAPTSLMKEMGYGEGYEYPHDDPDGVVDQEYRAGRLKSRRYYEPTNRGYEATIKRRLDKWRKILESRRRKRSE